MNKNPPDTLIYFQEYEYICIYTHRVAQDGAVEYTDCTAAKG